MRRACRRCVPSLINIVRQPASGLYNSPWARSEVLSVRCNAFRSPQAVARAFHQITSLSEQAATAEAVVEEQNAETAPISRFEELGTRGILHRNIVQNLKSMGVETMTEVQSATINSALKGDDIIAQAKTGTGKTLAFLLPVLQNIINVDPSLAQRVDSRRGPRSTADDIRAIVISPTRELAEQIAVEARKVVRGTGIVVQTAVGGTQKAAGLRAIQRQGCHILVGTPGRLNDILSDERTRVEAPDLSALVLDEADRLLDDGFWDAIKEIMTHLPKRKDKDRQTLMFSATVPKEIQNVVRSTLKPGFQFVRCVRDDEAPTHDRVPQRIIHVNGMENKTPALVELISRNVEKGQEPGAMPFKAIVYCNSTADVVLTTAALQGLRGPDSNPLSRTSDRSDRMWGGLRIQEIHAKLSQAQRTRAAENFRRCTSGVLLSSDVTARGMDFPNVTHVIQMSTPPNREQYIHRIGRTARAGKDGVAVMFITEAEERDCLGKLRGLKLVEDNSLHTASIDMTTSSQVPAEAGEIFAMVQKSMSEIPEATKAAAYRSFLGALPNIPPRKLIAVLNNLATYGWGLSSPPAIEARTAHKLGLSRVPGVVIGSTPRDEPLQNRGGSRFGMGRTERSLSSDFDRPRSRDGVQGGGRYSRGEVGFDRSRQDRFARDRNDSYGSGSRYGRRDSEGDRGERGERVLRYGVQRSDQGRQRFDQLA